MKTIENHYQMRVNQINPAFFRLKLIKTDQLREDVVFETISSTIPSTSELIRYYKQIVIPA
jgi:hypothetical protein